MATQLEHYTEMAKEFDLALKFWREVIELESKGSCDSLHKAVDKMGDAVERVKVHFKYISSQNKKITSEDVGRIDSRYKERHAHFVASCVRR